MHPLEHIPASFPSGKRWYGFYTHANAERKALEGITEAKYQAFVPFERRKIRKVNRRPREYEAALFPRYGFVEFDINDPEWGAIVDADGVVDLLRSNGVPIAVPGNVIEGLMLAANMGLFDRTKPYKEGMEVEVTSGPFAGFIGKIRKVRSSERVEVLLSLFGSERIATASLSTLRQLD